MTHVTHTPTHTTPTHPPTLSLSHTHTHTHTYTHTVLELHAVAHSEGVYTISVDIPESAAALTQVMPHSCAWHGMTHLYV